MNRLGTARLRMLAVVAALGSLGLVVMPSASAEDPEPKDIFWVQAHDFNFTGVPQATTAKNQTVCLKNTSATEEHEIVFAKLITEESEDWTIHDAADALRAANRRSQQPGGPPPPPFRPVDRSLGGNVTQAEEPFHEVEALPGESVCSEIKLAPDTPTNPETAPGQLGPGRYVYFCPLIAHAESGSLAHWEPELPGGGMIGFIEVV
jgi:hypothetical protein